MSSLFLLDMQHLFNFRKPILFKLCAVGVVYRTALLRSYQESYFWEPYSSNTLPQCFLPCCVIDIPESILPTVFSTSSCHCTLQCQRCYHSVEDLHLIPFPILDRFPKDMSMVYPYGIHSVLPVG